MKKENKIWKWLNTANGSFMKVFLMVVVGNLLSIIILNQSILKFTWNDIDSAIVEGLVAALGVIGINASNPLDKRYGSKIEPIKPTKPRSKKWAN